MADAVPQPDVFTEFPPEEEQELHVEPLTLSVDPVAPGTPPANVPWFVMAWRPPLPSDLSPQQRADISIDEQEFRFPMAEPHLSASAATAIREVYSLSGDEGVFRLVDAVGNIGPRFESMGRRGSKDVPPVFRAERERLEELAGITCERVAEAANKIAKRWAVNARAQTAREFARYTGMRLSSAPALEHSMAFRLDGDVLPLARSFVRVGAARAEMEDIQTMLAMTARNARAPSMRRIGKDLSDKLARRLDLVMSESLRFPVLYRIWKDRSVREEVARAIRSGNDADARIAIVEHTSFTSLVVDALATAWRASTAMERRGAEGDVDVWRYPVLVNETLARLGVPEGTVEWRAVQERLGEKETAVKVLHALSILAGLADVAAVLGSAAPPLALASAVVSLLLQGVEWLVSVADAVEDHEAFGFALNPADAFGTESTYLGAVIGLAFLVLQVPGAGGLKAAGR